MTETYGYDKTPTPPRDYDASKVPPEIKKRSTWVKTKFTGEDVAEAYGQAMEIAGIYAGEAKRIAEQTQYRQDAVEDFNNQVIQEMTDKDVISALEIIQARDGEQTLQDRFKRIDAKISQTTLDVINGLVKVSVGEFITTNGFYDFGNTYRYQVLQKVGDEIFLDTGKGFRITSTGEIETSNNLKITPVVTDKIQVGALGCNNQADTVCFQSAFNLAKSRDCNIDVDVDVNIDRYIDVYRGGSDEERKIIEISGRGIMSKNNAGSMFSNSLSRSGGNIKFNGIHFRSIEGVGTHIYHGGYLLRMYFENCHFINVDHLAIARQEAPWDYMQTVYFSGGTVVGGKGWFIDAHTAYDLSFTHSLVEHRESFAKIDLCHSVRITDNVIEGLDGKVLEVKNGRSLVFDDNYMEMNGLLIEGSSITIDNPSFSYGFDEMMNLSFQNNLYIATDEQRESQSYYCLSIVNYLKSITVKNNFCDCNFLNVTNGHTVSSQPSKLIEIYENNVINARKVLNDVNSSRFVGIGSGNMLTKTFARPTTLSNFTFFNSESNTADIQERSLLNVKCPIGKSTNRLGFSVGDVSLSRATQYVIGITAMVSDPNKESDGVKIVLRDDVTSEHIYEEIIDISDIQLSNGYVTFYSLKYLQVPVAKSVNLEVFMVPRTGVFSSSVQQVLTVGNVVIQRGHVATDSMN